MTITYTYFYAGFVRNPRSNQPEAWFNGTIECEIPLRPMDFNKTMDGIKNYQYVQSNHTSLEEFKNLAIVTTLNPLF